MKMCRNNAKYKMAGEFFGKKKDVPMCQVHLLAHLRGESNKISMIAEQALSQLNPKE